ncbi:MAG: JAB domain-containing protein [Firmicutes bacterium]|nr:JAB domain-containing protein [Bacillota bacterium]
MNVRIKDLPVAERPRERLINSGVENLSNEEILAILLKTGTKDTSVKFLASLVLSKLNNIGDLQNINYNQLLKVKGIGPSKATVLLAAIELGKRINNQQSIIQNLKVDNPKIIFDYYKPILKNKKQEHFYAVYLDNQKKVIDQKLLFIGTINKSLVHPQNIFKEAYLLDASAIVCIHNHPSGNVVPSLEDNRLTNSLVEIGNLLGIKIVDHIIIGDDKYYSFFESGEIL